MERIKQWLTDVVLVRVVPIVLAALILGLAAVGLLPGDAAEACRAALLGQ